MIWTYVKRLFCIRLLDRKVEQNPHHNEGGFGARSRAVRFAFGSVVAATREPIREEKETNCSRWKATKDESLVQLLSSHNRSICAKAISLALKKREAKWPAANGPFADLSITAGFDLVDRQNWSQTVHSRPLRSAHTLQCGDAEPDFARCLRRSSEAPAQPKIGQPNPNCQASS